MQIRPVSYGYRANYSKNQRQNNQVRQSNFSSPCFRGSLSLADISKTAAGQKTMYKAGSAIAVLVLCIANFINSFSDKVTTAFAPNNGSNNLQQTETQSTPLGTGLGCHQG